MYQKQNHLYQGRTFLPNTSNKYINFTETQQEFFNLGPNCHLSRIYDLNIKNNKPEIEMLHN